MNLISAEPAEVRRRIACPVRLRLAFGLATAVIATIGYQTSQHLGAGRAIARAHCWTWQWLLFHPAWLAPYFSMFVLMGLPWLLLPRAVLHRFAVAVLATGAFAWTVFVTYPTACVRPDPAMVGPVYRALVWFDGANNCLPCLHSAFAVLPAYFLARYCRSFQRLGPRLALVAWNLLIGVAIVALRQHTDLDVLAGVALGVATAAIDCLLVPPIAGRAGRAGATAACRRLL